MFRCQCPGILEIRAAEDRAAEVRAAEVRAAEVRAAEDREAEVRAANRLSSVVRDLLLLRAGENDLLRQRIEALTYFALPIDFDYIDDPRCRRYFKNIGTSWRLDDKEITALKDIAGALMRQAGDFQDLLHVYGASVPAGSDTVDPCTASTKASG